MKTKYVKVETLHRRLDLLLGGKQGTGCMITERVVRQLIDGTPPEDVVPIGRSTVVTTIQASPTGAVFVHTCKLCGERVRKTDPFCWHCGAPLFKTE